MSCCKDKTKQVDSQIKHNIHRILEKLMQKTLTFSRCKRSILSDYHIGRYLKRVKRLKT